MFPGTSLPIVLRSTLRLAAIAAAAAAFAPAWAETPPGRPVPAEKAPEANAPVKIFRAGTHRPATAAQSRTPRKIESLSYEQKKKFIGQDPGTHHITLTIANAVVKGKAALHFVYAVYVNPDWNEALIDSAPTSHIDLLLETAANKTYWIEIIVWRGDPKELCKGFKIRGPDGSMQNFTCTQGFSAGKEAQHLMFGYVASSAGTQYFTLWAQQRTEVYRYEITVQ